jgi:SAM-dependent methyltransferase
MKKENFNPNITYPGYFVRHNLLKGIERHAVSMKGVMLDFGCGSKPYKSLFTVDRYIGLDFENPGHSHANETIDVFYDGQKIPFDNDYFDSVFTSEVFEHVFNLPQILPEIRRVMKKGALILVTCPFAISEHEAPIDFARYSSFGLRHLMQENGFEVIEQEKLGNSLEVMTALWQTYLEIHITPQLKKVPLLGSLLEFIYSSLLNLLTIIFVKILPKGKELYLNNLVVCKKV